MGRRKPGLFGIGLRLAPALTLAMVAAGCLLFVGPQDAGAAVVTGTGSMLRDVIAGNTASISAVGGESTGTIRVGTFVDTDGSSSTEFTITIGWVGDTFTPPEYLTCTFESRHGVVGYWCTVFAYHVYEFSGTYLPAMYITEPFDETGYVEIQGGSATEVTTTVPTVPCIPSTHACQTRTAVPGQSVSLTSEGVTASTVGRGDVAVGTYGRDPGVPLSSSTGKFFGVQFSPSNGFTSLTVRDCSLGGGTALKWWNGKSWAAVVGATTTTTTAQARCVSVTLGPKSSPSLATIGKLSRLTSFDAVVFGVTR